MLLVCPFKLEHTDFPSYSVFVGRGYIQQARAEYLSYQIMKLCLYSLPSAYPVIDVIYDAYERFMKICSPVKAPSNMTTTMLQKFCGRWFRVSVQICSVHLIRTVKIMYLWLNRYIIVPWILSSITIWQIDRPSQVILLKHCLFYHLGPTRELIDIALQVRQKQTVRDNIFTWRTDIYALTPDS